MSINTHDSVFLGSWTGRFVKAGGLKLLFSIFASGDLQSSDGTVWCEWRQDCLRYHSYIT